MTSSASADTPGTPKAEPAAEKPAGAPEQRVELVEERTESTTTWANADGTTTVQTFTGPIRVKKPGGGWTPVDTTLIAENGVVKPKSAAADIAFSGGGSEDPLATVSRGSRSFGIGWDGRLPEPELDGSTALYRNAVDGGDLVVTALKEGFSHSVILRERPEKPVTFRLPVEAAGLTLEETADRRLHWEDGKGRVVAAAPLPVMWGSGEEPVSGEPRDLAPIDVVVEKDAKGSGQVLVLKPDTDFLADPDLTYPVTIDPTDSLMGPVTDTWIQYDDYLTSQRGSSELKTGTYNGSEKARSFLKFDVSKYAGKRITDTDLRLYSYYASTCQTTSSGNQVRRITSSWDPAAVSWSAQPTTTTAGAVTSKAAKGYGSACPAGHVNWDIDAIVQAWADGQPNHGVRIAAVDETDPLTWRRYHSANQTTGSHNATYEPSLTVTYNTVPGTATLVSPATGTATADTRPVLSAKATDVDAQQLTLAFEIWTAAGTAPLRTGTSTSVASGATATHRPAALPAGDYKWRARASDGADTGAWSGWRTFSVDTTAPTVPAITSTTHPSSAAWYNATTFRGALSASDASGVTGYAVKLDQNPTTPAGTTVTQTGTAVEWTGRADGTWWVHAAARDRAGLWSATKHLSFNVDTTAPGAPGGLQSTTHPVPDSAYAHPTASFSWSAPTDTSGVAGYTVTVDRSPGTLPPTTGTVQTETSRTVTVNADGTWYLHVRAKDKAGNWSSTAAHRAFTVDRTLPPSPVISSSSHPDQTSAYRGGVLSASWTALAAGAENGYSVVVDQNAGTVPDTQPETTGTTHTTTRGEGVWYLHVRGIDSAGKGGPTAHFRFTVDTTPPGAPTVGSTDYPANAWSGAPGQAGTFTVSPDGTGSVSLSYTLDGGASRTVAIDGGATELRITPATAGSHTLLVTTTDRAGNVSAPRERRFHVGTAAVTAPANGEVLVGSVDLAVTAPASLKNVTFLQRASAADPWEVIPAAQVTYPAEGTAVTWPVPLTGGVAPKLVWDTSSLAGKGSRQVGARFGGTPAPPEAEPVSVVVDRVEIIDGGYGDGSEESTPAKAYALELAQARAAAAPADFAPPYIDQTSGDLVAPVVDPSAVAQAAVPIDVLRAPADEGTDTPGEELPEPAKPDEETGGPEEIPALPADEDEETTGEESYEMVDDDDTPQAPDPSAPTVTQQVAPRAEIVERSVEALESVRDEVLLLTEAELPGVTGLHAAFVDAESNRVVVQTADVGSALVTALGERYGTDTVAVHLTSGVETIEPVDRYSDSSPYYGGARILSTLPKEDKWCTAGFPWRSGGKWYMLTAGHCTSGNGIIFNPSGKDYIGSVVRDNWNNSKGTVKLSGQKYFAGDLALYQVLGPEKAAARIFRGGERSTKSRVVADRWKRWAQKGDKVCTGGMVTGERCGWKVTATQATVKYEKGTVAKNVVVARKTESACVRKGDSGGPVYTVDGKGRAYARGIISGGGGGGGDHSGGLLDPCVLVFTDIGLAHSALPGTVARG
ncbi:DNRLRE domain-containing protein [Streptomyces arboris]|uniref:DNRLRE domain-containing protein n=1 Tax=Streptomyces arboris TaxID=2600619 RepID=UPI003BF4F6AC